MDRHHFNAFVSQWVKYCKIANVLCVILNCGIKFDVGRRRGL